MMNETAGDTIETNVGGARVTVNPQADAPATPSEKIIAKATEEVTVTDATGRKITLARPSLLDEYDFIEMLEDSAKNETFVGMAAPLLFVKKLDGADVHSMHGRAEMRALIKRLGRDGLNAVAAGIKEHFGDAVENPNEHELGNG